MHIRMTLFEPFPALLRRAAKFAILHEAGASALWSLAGCLRAGRWGRGGGAKGIGSTSGGREQTVTTCTSASDKVTVNTARGKDDIPPQ